MAALSEARRNHPARTDGSYAMEPFAFSVLRQAHFKYRCRVCGVALGTDRDRQYGSFCRRIGVYGRFARLLVTCQYVSCVSVLD